MKKGDKVVFINEDVNYLPEPIRHLTVGKVYEILTMLVNYSNPLTHIILIKDDKGIRVGIQEDWFVTLKEYRKQKLEKLNEKGY